MALGVMEHKAVFAFLTGFILFSSFIIRRLVLRFIYARQAKARGCASPQNLAPIKEPFLGLDFLWETLRAAKEGRYLPFIWERFQKCGYTFVTRRLIYETVHTIDPDNLKHILSTDFHSFRLSDVRVKAMGPLFGNGIFTTEGHQWAHARAILRPSFTRNNMAPLLRMMERHFQVLLRAIPANGTTFDLQQLFFHFTMDTATEFLLGASTHTLDPTKSGEREARFVEDYLVCCIEAVRQIQMGPLRGMSVNLKASGARERAWAYIDRFVDEALEMRRSGKLDFLIEEGMDNDNAGGAGVKYSFIREIARDTDDRAMLRDQILNVLLASRDTTAGLLSNLFFMLSRHPEVYAKLRAEVENTLHGEIPSEEVLKNMTYLKWCINESLRLHPVVPANTRQAAVDTTLPVGGGPDGKQPIFVKKGTCILYYVYAMHRREDIFGPEPETFNPERWNGLRPGWGFLPFNGGPRICLGQQFALTEASYVIVRMIQSFAAIESRDDRPWMEFHTLAVCSRNGVQVAARPEEKLI